MLLSACHHQTAAKRYPFTGRVVSIDAQSQSAMIDGDNIPGYMDAMAMSYTIKPTATLGQVAPGDLISGEVVVQSEATESSPNYWLENVKVTAHGKAPASSTSGSAQHIPARGDDVPDFGFTDQSGRHISLKQFHGKTVVLTFVYTRCPFPDFCPRMSQNFAEIYKQLSADPAAAARTQLLTISFEPEHDTPKVLRDYGFSVAQTHDPALFKRWEFAVPRTEDLPKIAASFGLIYKPDGGLITHNLSTTVIGPDGKIAKWYNGGDWQVSDLMKDAATVGAAKSPGL
jgi:protein SCO1/2